MKRIGNQLIFKQQNKPLCMKALAAFNNGVAEIERIESEEIMVGEDMLRAVAGGLARIALGHYGKDYHGLSQSKASGEIDNLFGTADNFIQRMLDEGLFT